MVAEGVPVVVTTLEVVNDILQLVSVRSQIPEFGSQELSRTVFSAALGWDAYLEIAIQRRLSLHDS